MSKGTEKIEVKSLNSPDEVRKFECGKLEVVKVADDGTEKTTKAGDVVSIPSGHDAWVVGNEKVVFVDFQGMADYAKQAR